MHDIPCDRIMFPINVDNFPNYTNTDHPLKEKRQHAPMKTVASRQIHIQYKKGHDKMDTFCVYPQA